MKLQIKIDDMFARVFNAFGDTSNKKSEVLSYGFERFIANMDALDIRYLTRLGVPRQELLELQKEILEQLGEEMPTVRKTTRPRKDKGDEQAAAVEKGTKPDQSSVEERVLPPASVQNVLATQSLENSSEQKKPEPEEPVRVVPETEPPKVETTEMEPPSGDPGVAKKITKRFSTRA